MTDSAETIHNLKRRLYSWDAVMIFGLGINLTWAGEVAAWIGGIIMGFAWARSIALATALATHLGLDDR